MNFVESNLQSTNVPLAVEKHARLVIGFRWVYAVNVAKNHDMIKQLCYIVNNMSWLFVIKIKSMESKNIKIDFRGKIDVKRFIN